jgi:hypothetical protein
MFSLPLASQDIYQASISNLNIRKGAGINFKLVGQLKKNETVQVLSIENGWAHIVTIDKKEDGFVNIKFLKKQTIEHLTNGNLNNSSNTECNEDQTMKNILNNIWFVTIIGGIIATILGSLIMGLFKSGTNISFSFEKIEPLGCISLIGIFSVIAAYEIILTFFTVKFFLPALVRMMGTGFGILTMLFLWLIGVVIVPGMIAYYANEDN